LERQRQRAEMSLGIKDLLDNNGKAYAEFEGNGCCCTPACCKVRLYANPCCADGFCVYQTCGPCPFCDCMAPFCCGQGFCRCAMCGENTFAVTCPPAQSCITFEDKDTVYGQCPMLKCCACGAGYVRTAAVGAGPAIEAMER